MQYTSTDFMHFTLLGQKLGFFDARKSKFSLFQAQLHLILVEGTLVRVFACTQCCSEGYGKEAAVTCSRLHVHIYVYFLSLGDGSRHFIIVATCIVSVGE